MSVINVYQFYLSVMAEPKYRKDVKSDDNEEQTYLKETFYKKNNTNIAFSVILTSKGLSLITHDSKKSETLLLQDIIGSKCKRRQKQRSGSGFSVCSSLVSRPSRRYVDKDSDDIDENDIGAYLDIYVYNLKPNRRKPERKRRLITLQFISYDKYEDNNREAEKWLNKINCLITNEPTSKMFPQNNKKILVILNPKSGSGKAKKLFLNKVVPIWKEAQREHDLEVTKDAKYARRYIRELTMKDTEWHAIVSVGGDGVFFEVLNGIFERHDWETVLANIPLGIIPCGSGNGLARTICHHYNEPYITHDLTGMSIAAVRGKTASMDVVRVETKSKIMFSFLSVGWGLLADIDIESEKLRIMGGQRFVFGAINRLIGLRTYKGAISYLRIEDVNDFPKPKISTSITHSVSYGGELDSPPIEVYKDCSEHSERSRRRVDSFRSTFSRPSDTSRSYRDLDLYSATSRGSETRSPDHVCTHGPASRLPSIMSQLPSDWERMVGEFVMIYSSYQSYIGEDLLFAPDSQLSDGVIWLLIIKAGISRSQIYSFLTGMNNENHSEINSEYIKMIPVSAFRLEPENGGENGNITVDGELVEYGPIQAEIFPNVVKLLVPPNNV